MHPPHSQTFAQDYDERPQNMSLLDALDQLVQAVQPEEDPAVDLLLASAVAREAITFELISGSNRHFGCSYKQEELLSHLRSQWRRAAKERDFENMALALIQKCTAAGKLSVRGWSDETEEVTVRGRPLKDAPHDALTP